MIYIGIIIMQFNINSVYCSLTFLPTSHQESNTTMNIRISIRVVAVFFLVLKITSSVRFKVKSKFWLSMETNKGLHIYEV